MCTYVQNQMQEMRLNSTALLNLETVHKILWNGKQQRRKHDEKIRLHFIIGT